MTTNGRSGRVSRAFSRTDNPSRSGIRTSITTASTGSAAIFSSASRPPPATSTAYPSIESARESVSWMFFSSSTMRTVAGMVGRDVNPGWREGRKSFDTCSERSHLIGIPAHPPAGAHVPTGGHMRRVLVLSFTLAGVFALAGCPAKPKNGECKSSADCASQEGFGKVCVEGRCQECGADADCREGFVCRTNMCVPKPQCQAYADCSGGQRCENERCVAAREEAKPKEEAGAVPKECAEPGAFTIRFGFDQSSLTGESQGTLQKLSECLKKAPAKRVVVSGHADERGTTQYNIALGARRAEAARKYLSDLGAGTKLETVSFGKEKPLCTESTEDCWSRNRRDEFEVAR